MCDEHCFPRAVKFKKISDIFLFEISSCFKSCSAIFFFFIFSFCMLLIYLQVIIRRNIECLRLVVHIVQGNLMDPVKSHVLSVRKYRRRMLACIRSASGSTLCRIMNIAHQAQMYKYFFSFFSFSTHVNLDKYFILGDHWSLSMPE